MTNIISDHFGVPLEVEGHPGQHNLFHGFPGLNILPPPTIFWTSLSTAWNPGPRAHCISGMSGLEPGCCLSSCSHGILMAVLVPLGHAVKGRMLEPTTLGLS